MAASFAGDAGYASHGQAAGVGAGDRVLELLRKLETDAEALRKEHGHLAAERARWMPPIAPAADAAESPALPSRCRSLLVEASAQDRRVLAATRGVQVADNLAQRLRAQKTVTEEATDKAVEAAEARRKSAELRLEELRAERRKAEEGHRAWLAVADSTSNADVEARGQRTEQVLVDSEEEARRMRREVAEERERCKRQIAALQAAFEERCAQLDASVQKHAEESQRRMAELASQCEDAQRAAEEGWRQGRAEAESHQTEARELADRHDQEKDAHEAEHRWQQGVHDASHAAEMARLYNAEEVLRKDRTAEEDAEKVLAEIAARVASRRQRSADLAASCPAEMRQLMDEAVAKGARAASAAVAAHSAVDAEIEAFCQQIVAEDSSRLTEDHARLALAATEARKAFAARLESLQAQAQRHREASGAALLAADQRVDELRLQAHAHAEERLKATSESVRGIQEERLRIAAAAEEQVRHAQEQMVRFVDTQRLEMLTTLEIGGAQPSTAAAPG